MAKQQKSNKGRKYGRNRKKCERYAMRHQRTRNNPARRLHDPERMFH